MLAQAHNIQSHASLVRGKADTLLLMGCYKKYTAPPKNYSHQKRKKKLNMNVIKHLHLNCKFTENMNKGTCLISLQ